MRKIKDRLIEDETTAAVQPSALNEYKVSSRETALNFESIF